MSRKLLLALLILAAGSFATGIGYAADSGTQVGVAVEATDLLRMPESLGLTLASTTPSAREYDEFSTLLRDGVQFSHNHANR